MHDVGTEHASAFYTYGVVYKQVLCSTVHGVSTHRVCVHRHVYVRYLTCSYDVMLHLGTYEVYTV